MLQDSNTNPLAIGLCEHALQFRNTIAKGPVCTATDRLSAGCIGYDESCARHGHVVRIEGIVSAVTGDCGQTIRKGVEE